MHMQAAGPHFSPQAHPRAFGAACHTPARAQQHPGACSVRILVGRLALALGLAWASYSPICKYAAPLAIGHTPVPDNTAALSPTGAHTAAKRHSAVPAFVNTRTPKFAMNARTVEAARYANTGDKETGLGLRIANYGTSTCENKLVAPPVVAAVAMAARCAIGNTCTYACTGDCAPV